MAPSTARVCAGVALASISGARAAITTAGGVAAAQTGRSTARKKRPGVHGIRETGPWAGVRRPYGTVTPWLCDLMAG
jgi:hypothetical protein